MLTTWEQRVRRDGITLDKIHFPVPPPSQQYLADMFEKAITPRTKVILLCHITNLTGQIFPTREICRMARARGIKTIVDGAHAFAHFPFDGRRPRVRLLRHQPPQVAAAPIGTGFLYVRRENIAGLWPLQPAAASQADNIRKFEEIGTHPAANHNAIAEALVFQRGIGIERKAARLRYLTNRWAQRLEKIPGVRIHTPFDPAQSCGLANVGLDAVDCSKLADHLWTKYRIIVAPSSATITRASASRRTSTRRSMRSTRSPEIVEDVAGEDRCRLGLARDQKPEDGSQLKGLTVCQKPEETVRQLS